MAQPEESGPGPSRTLIRILDRRRRLDYVWLVIFAALPLALAAWVGALQTADGFAGYWDRHQWPLMVVILPVAALVLRTMAGRIAPVTSAELPEPPPPVVRLIRTRAGRQAAYAVFRSKLLARHNLLVAVLITLLIHVLDMGQLGGIYASSATRLCNDTETPGTACAEVRSTEGALRVRVPLTNAPWLSRLCCEVPMDWSVAFLRAPSPGPAVGKWQNLLLNASAYAVQFAVILIGILLITLIVRHNLLFLSLVYQRHRVRPGEAASTIHIDIDDPEKCFGFRTANDAFNAQVLALAIAAIFILTTRFANVGPGTGLFPYAGQWLALVAWLVALAIVSMPILVKLLPRLPSRSAASAPTSLVEFLQEFLSDEAWAVDRNTPREEIDLVATRFAENSFWPTGNNRAWQLYFLSFCVFFVALVPDPRAIAGLHDLPEWSRYVGWAAAAGIAWITTWALFACLRAVLAFVDSRLVETPGRAVEPGTVQRQRRIPIGVFISYRRGDTAAYTGRLYDSLSRHVDRSSLFMDLDKIPGGVDFVVALQTAIDSASAMIVVIGPQWLTIRRGDGPPRIEDPDDFVHQELALGLQNGIRMYPVLVGGASMPSEEQLPDGLQALARRNAREISDSRWDHDVRLLVEDLETTGPNSRSGADPHR